jgi:uncharacterized membrane protein
MSPDNTESLLSHLRVEHILALVELLWPFALTAGLALLRWKLLQFRAGFLVVGVLGCFGLQAFLARLARYVFWTYVAPAEPHSYSTAVHFTDPIVIIVVSMLVSVPLLLWLARLLGIPQGDIHAR